MISHIDLLVLKSKVNFTFIAGKRNWNFEEVNRAGVEFAAKYTGEGILSK